MIYGASIQVFFCNLVKERFVAQYVNGFTMARAFHVAVPVHRNIFIHGGLDKHSQLLNNACYFSLGKLSSDKRLKILD